jgi:hypothetical protein
MIDCKNIKLSYDDIYVCLKQNKLNDDALNRNWFAIYRGGLPIAHMLSILYNKEFGIIYPKHEKIIYPDREDLVDSALIIDDNTWEGGTIKKSIDILDKYFNFNNIKIFFFLCDPERKIIPDFYSITTIKDGQNYWYESPWEEFDELHRHDSRYSK